MSAVVEAASARTVAALPERRACPLCGADGGSVLHDNAMVGIGRFGFGYPVVACDVCGMVYAGQVLADEALSDYYRTLSKYEGGGEPSAFDVHRARAAAAFAARVTSVDGSLLDVGCSTGTFLVAARACGVARVAGIEPAAGAVRIARTRGLDVDVGDANAFDRFDAFETIALLAVLEHLAHPRTFVERLARSMRPGACLILEVPDADAFGRYEAPGTATEPFGEFSIEHINFFGRASLARLGRTAGLAVVSVERIDYLNGWGGLLVALRKGGVAPESLDDARCRRSIETYVARSSAAMLDVDARLAAVRGPVVLYGAGSHTARLLARDAASSLNVATIVDRNSNLIGRAMAGTTIEAPGAIGAQPALPVVVSTFNARQAITDLVTTRYANAAIALYSAP